MGTGGDWCCGRTHVRRVFRLLGGKPQHRSVPRLQGLQPSSRIVHAIPSLSVTMAPHPFAPTGSTVGGHDLLAVVESHAVLKPHVAFVDELNARTTTGRQQYQRRQGCRLKPTRHHAPERPPPERHCNLRVPFSSRPGNSLTKVPRKRQCWCYGRGVFTGLVTAIGELTNRQPGRTGSRVHIACSELGTLEMGESIAVNGTCLTVAAIHKDGFEGDMSGETLERTTLGRLPPRSPVNLERALRVGDRLGGHWVTGHVDGVVRLIGREPVGASVALSFGLPQALRPYVATKGSVALDGVSLTVNSSGNGSFSVMLIPHTRGRTTLDRGVIGTDFNLEVDVLARYVVHAMTSAGIPPATTDDTTPAASPDAGLSAALSRAGIL